MLARGLVILLASVCLTATAFADSKAHPASPKSDIENDNAIRKLYSEFTDAWNKHDVPAMAKMWTLDGDHVEPDAHVAKGRDEIQKLFSAQHATAFKDSKLTLTVEQVWFVTGDVALVDGTYEVSGVHAPDGTEIPARTGRLTSVFLKENGKWWITADRLMIPTVLPYKKPAKVTSGGAKP